MKELETSFIGTGEVRGFEFQQIERTEHGYIYQVKVSEREMHYETFRRKENTRFNCVSYPTSKAFGIWAWSNKDIEKAKQKLQSLNN